MNSIAIPYHLLIPSLLSLLMLSFVAVKQKQLPSKAKFKKVWIMLAVFLSIYTIIVGGAMILDLYYQIDLNSYDLNKDGFYSGAEVTDDQKAAMLNMTNNTARNFSFLTGLIYAGLVSIAFYVMGIISKIKIKKIINRKRTL